MMPGSRCRRFLSPAALLLSLSSAAPLAAQSTAEYKAGKERLLAARESRDVARYLVEAEAIGAYRNFKKGFALVVENFAGFASELDEPLLRKVATSLAGVLDSREERLLARWAKRHRRSPGSPAAIRSKERILRGEEKRIEALRRGLKSWFPRLVLLEARHARGAQGAALEGLADEHPAVVRRSLTLLEDRREVRVVDAVLAAYVAKKDERDSEWTRTFLKMKGLCARVFGVELPGVIDYRGLLNQRRQLADPFALPGKEAAAAQRPQSRTGLFGLPVTGKNIVFVLDVSGSMNSVDIVQRRVPARARTGTRGRRQTPAIDTSNSRLERSKRQLAGTVRRLGEDVRFNIMTYSSPTFVSAWQQGLVAATSDHKDNAREFIRLLEAGGGTATDVALERAFGELSVDTIYLISDGVPTHVGSQGNAIPPDTESLMAYILARVGQLNFLRDVRVFTLGFPQVDRGYRFLEELARRHGGKFIRIDAE